jgi:hypothetical protein
MVPLLATTRTTRLRLAVVVMDTPLSGRAMRGSSLLVCCCVTAMPVTRGSTGRARASSTLTAGWRRCFETTARRPASRMSLYTATCRLETAALREPGSSSTSTARCGVPRCGKDAPFLLLRCHFTMKVVERRVFSSFAMPFYNKVIVLPRQARDRHRGNSKKRAAFSQAAGSPPGTPPLCLDAIHGFKDTVRKR